MPAWACAMIGLLQPPRRVEIGERRLLPGDRRLGLGERRAIVAVVELDQEIAGMDRLVVGDRDLGDEARDLGRDDRDVAADIGVVGALDEAPDGPPVVAVPGRAGQHDESARRRAPACGRQIFGRVSGRTATVSRSTVTLLMAGSIVRLD